MTMEGFPPQPGDRWTRDSWQTAPANRWTFRHLREVVPTARVARSRAARRLEHGPDLDLDLLVPGADEERTLADVLAETETDGFAVLHRGRLVAEWYADGHSAQQTHLLMSVSKSIVGCVVGVLAGRGQIDLDRTVEDYLPEVVGHGYQGATVHDVLDMRSGVRFSEAYTDPDAEVRCIEEVIGWSPRVHDGLPTSLYDYLAGLSADHPHGRRFDYRSCETDLLGWICERVTGTRMPQLLSELVWSRLGTEEDLDAAVDAAGSVFHDGGLACTLRDAARFGQLLLDDGAVDGVEVVPSGWIADTLAGAPDSADVFTAAGHDGWLPGGHYRNQIWVPGADRLLCLGIHGQLIWVDRARDLVVVKHSSWPTAQDLGRLTSTFAAIEAIATELTESSAPRLRRSWLSLLR